MSELPNRAAFEATLADAMPDYFGCGDNSCLVRKPRGMATNDGCRCDEKRGPGRASQAALWFKHRLHEARAELAKRDADDINDRFLEWRGVETACKDCGGAGRKAYGGTSTWRGGIGGQAITSDVCDLCWGTGDANRKGADLRKLTRTDAALAAVRVDEERADRDRLAARVAELEAGLRALVEALPAPKCDTTNCQRSATGSGWTSGRSLCDEHAKGQDGDEFRYTAPLRAALLLLGGK